MVRFIMKYIFIFYLFDVINAMLFPTSSIPNSKTHDFFYLKFEHSSYLKNVCKHSQI
jgi:hypothetical protein